MSDDTLAPRELGKLGIKEIDPSGRDVVRAKGPHSSFYFYLLTATPSRPTPRHPCRVSMTPRLRP